MHDDAKSVSQNGIPSTSSPLTNSTDKHAERKYDLNSFASASMKVDVDQNDDDDDLNLVERAKKAKQNKTRNETKFPAKKPKIESDDENDVDSFASASMKVEKMDQNGDEDDLNLAERVKKAKQSKTGNETKSAKKRKQESDDEYEDNENGYKPSKKKSKPDKDRYKDKKPSVSSSSASPSKSSSSPSSKPSTTKITTTKNLPTKPQTSPRKGRKAKEEETQEVWKWWEEEQHAGGIKWKTLEHKGPLFAPPYERLPDGIHFYYDGKTMKLSENAEEVAAFYAKMLDHDYTSQEAFNKNFFKDWRKVMNSKEKEKISDLKKCDFKEMSEFFKKQSEERRNRSKEEKLKEKEEREKIQKEYGIANIDNHKEKIGNFRIEPPGLFRGRGTHPKMGMLKKRIQPEDVIINCSKGSKVPSPPPGHKWKEVRHDNTVTWLASWSENIMGSIKYVMLNPASKIKGEKDWAKYEVARKLKTKVGKIRETYRVDLKSKEMKTRQRAVAVYFIDKLALRAGNEKEEGETADTVGCCSLRCEHMKLYDELDGEQNVVEFDFLGKDSIRYYNKVSVEKRVFKNLKLFMEGKNPGDDVFDRLNTMILNKHLQSLMDGLTAKVFRTYNASFTLRQQLELLTKKEMTPAEKLLAYNRANRQVAVLCNHQRAVPKMHGKQMDLLQEKINESRGKVKDAKREAKDAKKKYKERKNDNNKKIYEQKKKTAARLEEQLQKLELRATDKEENKEISLGTSKLNYLDPRISVAWCKKWDVPIEKVYNKTQREKFRWAIDMAGPDFLW